MSRLLVPVLLLLTACEPSGAAIDDSDAPGMGADTADAASPGDTGSAGGPVDTGDGSADTGASDGGGDTADGGGDTAAPADTGGEEDTGSAADTGDTGDTDVSAGACDNPADVGVLGSASDISGTSQTCTTGCITTQPLAGCVSTCIESDLGLSPGCSDCFGSYSSCLISNCAVVCIVPTSGLCQGCLATNCNPAFEACAGVPLP